MKTPLKSRRPSPAEALEIATTMAPMQPPAEMADAGGAATTLNLRVRRSTVDAIETIARGRGLTMKQVICQALQSAGVAVASSDLEDRTPRRR